jgi:hypothetical protein
MTRAARHTTSRRADPTPARPTLPTATRPTGISMRAATHTSTRIASSVEPPAFGRRVGWLVGVVLAVVGVLAVDVVPAGAAPSGGGVVKRAGHVIVVGIAGLRWDDLDPGESPTLWGLAKDGSVGVLTDRAVPSYTCPGDGWLTLGAGNRAQYGTASRDGSCEQTRVSTVAGDDGSATLEQQSGNRNEQQDALPGALATAVSCTTAVGLGAAIGAARPSGLIDRYEPRLPDDPAPLLSACPLTMVDAGVVAANPGADRVRQVRAADDELATVLAARPAGSTVLVVGLSDTGAPARLHVAIASGAGFGSGWLSSDTTERTGYVQLVDVAPTVLGALGGQRPAAFSGQPWARTASRPATDAALRAARRDLVDADRVSVATAHESGRFVTVLVVLQLALYVLAGLLLAQLRRPPGPEANRRRPRLTRTLVELGAAACALVIPAMLLADLVPWWRAPRSGWTLVGVVAVVVTALTAVTWLGPWRRLRFGRIGALGTMTALVIGLDALTGAHLELDNVVGYAAVTGDRYTGLGMIGLGAFLAAVLMVAGCVATQVRRRLRAPVVVLIGAMAVLVVGSPFLGGDAAGGIGVTAGVAVAAVIATGGWLTLTRLGWAIVAGVLVTSGFAAVDLLRPADERGHLGRFLTNLFTGQAGPAFSRVMEANMVATGSSPLTLLAVAVGVFWMAVLMRPVGGLRRVYGLFPAVRGGIVGTSVAGLVAGLLAGGGLIVAAAAASVATPLMVLFCVQVQADAVAVPPTGDAAPASKAEKQPVDDVP